MNKAATSILICSVVLATGILVLTIPRLTRQERVVDSSLTGAPKSMPVQSETGTSPAPVSRSTTVKSICFVRGNWIYLKNLVNGTETRVAEGLYPELSPTGDNLIFFAVKKDEPQELFIPPGRMRVLNMATKAVREFEQFRDVQIGTPVWSNDGMKLAITKPSEGQSKLSIVIVNVRTGNVEKEFGSEGTPSDGGLYLDSWTPDDRSLLLHSLKSLYEINVGDGAIQKLPVDELFKLSEISSATRFSFSFDRRYLLFDKMIDTPEEPQTAVISLFDLNTKTVRRVTPRGVQGREPVWLPSNQEILFSRVEWIKDKWRSSICKISIDGKGLTTLASDADSVSYSN